MPPIPYNTPIDRSRLGRDLQELNRFLNSLPIVRKYNKLKADADKPYDALGDNKPYAPSPLGYYEDTIASEIYNMVNPPVSARISTDAERAAKRAQIKRDDLLYRAAQVRNRNYLNSAENVVGNTFARVRKQGK